MRRGRFFTPRIPFDFSCAMGTVSGNPDFCMKTLFIVLSAFLAARVFPVDYVQTLEVEYPDAASARAASSSADLRVTFT